MKQICQTKDISNALHHTRIFHTNYPQFQFPIELTEWNQHVTRWETEYFESQTTVSSLTSWKFSQMITCGKPVSLDISTFTLSHSEMRGKVCISVVKDNKVDKFNNTCLWSPMTLACQCPQKLICRGKQREGEKLDPRLYMNWSFIDITKISNNNSDIRNSQSTRC